MSYFSLRKHAPEPEPDEAEEETPAVEEAEGENGEEERPAAKSHGPLLTGLLGPGRWLTAHFGINTAWAVHVVAVWAIGFYGGWTAAGVILVWLVAVLLFVPTEHLDRFTDAIERRSSGHSKASPATPASTGGEAIRGLLLELIGEGRGVHLRTVLAYLQEHGQWEGKEVADLRQHLEALGIPVRPKVKVGGTPTRGVLKADLEALPPVGETPPSPAPSPAA
jgi:hypothetical protein